MKVKWIKAHGFNDESAGENNIDKDRELIVAEGERRGLEIDVDSDSADYGYWSLRKVRYMRHEPVSRMVAAIENAIADGDHVVLEGYSNGWNYLLQAIQIVCDKYFFTRGDQKIIMLGVHPAGRTKPDLPKCVHSVELYITRSDWAVRLATWASFFRLAPQWGRLGYKGYQGDDERFNTRHLSNIAKGHGGAYHDTNLGWMAAEKVECVDYHLSH